MSNDLIKVYKQLEAMPQTEEILQVKEQIKESLYQKMKMHTLELSAIGRVLGYDELKNELHKAIAILEIEQLSEKK